MPRTTKIVLVVLLGLGSILGAWAVLRFFRNAETELDVPRVALTVKTRGGLCVYGGCSESLTLYASGQYRITRSETDRTEDRVLRLGTLPSETTVRLLGLINTTDFSALRTTPFTDICPAAYDGSETTYTFVLESGQKEVLDTCENVLDFATPLLREVKSLPTSGQ